MAADAYLCCFAHGPAAFSSVTLRRSISTSASKRRNLRVSSSDVTDDNDNKSFSVVRLTSEEAMTITLYNNISSKATRIITAIYNIDVVNNSYRTDYKKRRWKREEKTMLFVVSVAVLLRHDFTWAVGSTSMSGDEAKPMETMIDVCTGLPDILGADFSGCSPPIPSHSCCECADVRTMLFVVSVAVLLRHDFTWAVGSTSMSGDEAKPMETMSQLDATSGTDSTLDSPQHCHHLLIGEIETMYGILVTTIDGAPPHPGSMICPVGAELSGPNHFSPCRYRYGNGNTLPPVSLGQIILEVEGEFVLSELFELSDFSEIALEGGSDAGGLVGLTKW
ncbi:hypothetical protein C0Q70_15414 [Pomacea canaliculata]|uniref:Uncharacterized protein n=1 Tax=Pomacea canaliculata TaxID=400727 RepID=A0A2T7NUS9_POMCA|nr:hypothetical protein C0Q70_15414 [Pomacea canaliculata]